MVFIYLLAATYVIGFCEAVLDMVAEYHVGFEGIVATLGNRTNDLRLVGAICLVAILLLVMVGMDWVTRVSLIPGVIHFIPAASKYRLP